MTIQWTPEQEAILAHPVDRHGRILAGPGTGKSTTVLTLAESLQEEHGSEVIKVTTFTRAATAELALNAAEGGHDLEPTTLHSFALSLLMANQDKTDLPRPLRIPDNWEARELIRADIARRLRAGGFHNVDRRTVGKLEREMSARWESLDPELLLLADVDPELRNAYLGMWQQHRRVFGYSLFAEMPLSASEMLEDHPGVDLRNLRLLIVDEYQDLNRCEIGFLQALAARGVRILAVGDDDQSIYSFRMADPAGIRDFDRHFPDALEYNLSVSQRCGENILEVARALIGMAPDRPNRPPLVPRAGIHPGVFSYLSFRDAVAEREGVARLVATLAGDCGMRPSEIVVMVRGDHNQAWSDPLREALASRGIPAVDVEAALRPLLEPEARNALALGRLAQNRNDDLAWWGLLKTTRGVSDNFVRMVADDALARGERFSERLVALGDDPLDGAPGPSLGVAIDLVREVLAFLDEVALDAVPACDEGWAPWLLETACRFGIDVAEEFAELVTEVGRVTPQSEGVGHFLNQLEPVTKDLALQVDAVAIMSMSRSKGLTRRAAITMGVENGVIPSPRAADEEEERRLLYVAMTRGKHYSFMTMATRRTDRTAFAGGATGRRATRGRSPFFARTPIRPRDGEAYVRAFQCVQPDE